MDIYKTCFSKILQNIMNDKGLSLKDKRIVCLDCRDKDVVLYKIDEYAREIRVKYEKGSEGYGYYTRIVNMTRPGSEEVK